MILLVLVIVVGPQRLPEYAQKLGQLVRQARVALDNAKTQIADEVGPEFGDLDLSDLDPRQYDPRKIVRDALGEDLASIRRDLTSPITSVVETAKATSNAAVKAAGTATASAGRTSASRAADKKAADERKAEEVRAASERQKAAAAQDLGDKEDTEAEQAVAEAEAVTAKVPRARAVDSDLAEPVAVVDVEAGPAGGQLAQQTQESTATAEEREEPEQESPEGEHPASDVAAAAVLATVLPAAPSAPDGRVRPLSPRDIVRAANSAARTRTEALQVPAAD